MIAVPRNGTGPRFRAKRGRGFTLIEVLLATGITAGLLLVALFFHQQSAALRNGLLDESARLTAVRQVMGRLSRELAGMAPEAGAFAGDSRSIAFVWRRPPVGSAVPGAALDELCRVRYEAVVDEETQETAPLRRTETPLETSEPALDEPESGSVYALMEPSAATDGAAMDGEAVETTYRGIAFAQFRFWDGEVWTETWEAGVPPLGVEVSLGFVPATESATAEDYDAELFRRLIPVLAAGPVAIEPGRSPALAEEGTGTDEAENGPPSSGPEAASTSDRRGRGRP